MNTLLLLLSLVSPEVLYLAPSDTIVRRAATPSGGTDYTAYPSAALYIDFETAGATTLCDDTLGNWDEQMFGTVNQDTTNFAQGLASGDPQAASSANECRDSGGGTWTSAEGNPMDCTDCDFTIAFKMRYNATHSSLSRVIDTGTNTRVRISINASGNTLRVRGGNSIRTCSGTLTAGNWYSFMVAVDGDAATDSWECWQDGVSQDTWTANHTAATKFAMFGDQNGNTGADVNLDDVILLGETLVGADALAIHNDCADGSC